MRPVQVIEGRMVPLDRADVDTDQIMPKQHLKRVERTGFGELLFGDWRAQADPARPFILDEPARAGAKVLVAGPNFGSGSSREHAPWGLQQWGFEALIAPSFADIFTSNCAKIGLLAVVLPAGACARMARLAEAEPTARVRVDLEAQRVEAWDAGGAAVVSEPFEVDAHTRHLLLEGLDDIALTLQRAGDIDAFETQRPTWLPTTTAR